MGIHAPLLNAQALSPATRKAAGYFMRPANWLGPKPRYSVAHVGQRLLTSDALRPGWLGRVASECL